MVKNDENMKMSYKDMPTYALNLAIWAHLAPQCQMLCAKRSESHEIHGTQIIVGQPMSDTLRYGILNMGVNYQQL